MVEFIFRQATISDRESVLKLYDSVRGTGFCTWNEFYPGMEEIDMDVSEGTLYLMMDGEKLAGAISVVVENELDEQPFWTINEGAREIARVVSGHECRGQGLALRMVQEVERVLKAEGVTAIHLLAAVGNIPAWKTYEKDGFLKRADDVFEYGNTYFAYEKAL